MHSDSASVPTARVLTEILECENREEQDEFVQVFTSQPLSAVSSSYVSDHYGYSEDSSAPADYYGHDSQTQTQIYIGKLLDICLHKENQVCWYRDILCFRAKQQAGCPTGKLMNRKTTTNCPRIIKYARDFYVLYAFIQSEKSVVDVVFDKQKPHSSVTDPAKVNSVEFSVSLQNLSQRLAQLEESVSLRDKTILSLNSELKDLRSQHNALRSEFDCFKA